jgi:hypothetical protein
MSDHECKLWNGGVRPDLWRLPMTTKQAREEILYHDGQIFAVGHLWEIVTKPRGCGLQLVTLRLWEPAP